MLENAKDCVIWLSRGNGNCREHYAGKDGQESLPAQMGGEIFLNTIRHLYFHTKNKRFNRKVSCCIRTLNSSPLSIKPWAENILRRESIRVGKKSSLINFTTYFPGHPFMKYMRILTDNMKKYLQMAGLCKRQH